jgi:hypothetical protein
MLLPNFGKFNYEILPHLFIFFFFSRVDSLDKLDLLGLNLVQCIEFTKECWVYTMIAEVPVE